MTMNISPLSPLSAGYLPAQGTNSHGNPPRSATDSVDPRPGTPPDAAAAPVGRAAASGSREGSATAAGDSGAPRPAGNATQTGAELTAAELREIRQLQVRDRQVRAHEQAHLAAAGSLAASRANYQYVTGADGHRYAVGGEVSIDTSQVSGNPQATLNKAQQIRRAALAPANPSAQDLRVAADAARVALQAQVEIRQEHSEARAGAPEPATEPSHPAGQTGAPIRAYLGNQHNPDSEGDADPAHTGDRVDFFA